MLIIAMLMAFMPFSDLNFTVNAASSDRDNYESTYGVSYEELFRKYPIFLQHKTVMDYFGFLDSQLNDVDKEFSNTDIAIMSYYTALKEGVSFPFVELAAALGLGDSYDEQRLDNVTLEYVKSYLSYESPLMEQKASDAISSFKDLNKIRDLTSTVERDAFIAEIKAADNHFTDKQIDDMADAMFKEYDDLFKDLKTAAERCEAFLLFIELNRLDRTVINELINNQQTQDSGLYTGLCRLRAKRDQNFKSYFINYYLNDKVKSVIKKVIKKAPLLGSPEATLISAMIQVADMIFKPVTADKYIEFVYARSFISSCSSNVTAKQIYFLKNYATNDDIKDYEMIFSSYVTAYRVAFTKAIQIKKKNNALLQQSLDSLNGLTYDNYIKACLTKLATAIKNGEVDPPDARPIIGKDPPVVKDNTQTIRDRFNAIQAQYPPNVNATYTDSWGGAIQCFGFARMVFSKLFGCEMPYAYMNAYRYKYIDNSNVILIGQLEEGNVTVDNLKQLLSQAKLGDIIQASGVSQHTMMVVSVNDTGVEVYDANWKTSSDQPDCVINQHWISYSYLSQRYNQHNDYSAAGFSLYRAANYGDITGDGTYVFYDDSVNFQIENGVLVKYKGWQRDIVIPDTVTSIGASAFSGNKYIRSVYIPDTVKSIGESAFENCVNLYCVQMTDSVKDIESSAFKNCSSLIFITLSESLLTISYETFKNCYALPSVTIPDSVTKIESNAFENCTNLKDVTLSKSLEYLGGYVFGSTAIERIEIPKSLTEVYYYEGWNSDNSANGPFLNCAKLKTVTFEEGTTEICDNLLSGCTGLEEIVIPDTITKIGWRSFQMSENLKSVIIPDSVTEIDYKAFYKCTSLETIVIPDSVTKIDSETFNCCTALYSVKLSNKINVLPTFRDCESLSDINLIEGIKSLDKYAFENCKALKSIVIPEGVTLIDEYAFNGCKALESISLPQSLQKINSNAFYQCQSMQEIIIPKNTKTIGYQAFYNCKSLRKVEMTDSVTSIGDSAFQNCEALTDLTLSKNVKTIGTSVFRGCSVLSNVVIPDGVTKIGDYAFAENVKLTDVTIPKSVTSISSNAFSYPKKMTIHGYAGSYAEEYANSKGITFVAIQPFVVTYDANGGTGAPESQSVMPDENLVITGTVPTRDGYSFMGWALTQDAIEAAYQPNGVFKANTNTILYAVWEKDDSTSIYSLDASPASEQTIGEPVVLTATGGSSYRFYYEQNGKWVNIRNYSSESSCVWTPTVPRRYTIYVDIKDETGKVVTCRRIEYTVTDAYTFTLDKEGEQNVGVNMTLTAKGGSSYKFYYEYNGAWCNITTNTTGVCEWSPKYAGNYMLYVDIKDASGKVIACRTQAFKLNDPFSLFSDAQTTELPYGNTINFIAAGGTSYKFYYEKQGEWVRVQDFSSKNTCAWTPTEAGKYNFYCDIKDTSGAVVSCKRMTFNITNPYSFTADKATTQPVGTKITFTATGGYQYKFYYEKDGSWVRIQSFSTADTCAWTPTVAGRYNVYCDIADENGTVLVYKGMEFVIGSVSADSYTFKTSVESSQPMNTAVTLTATGGSSYKFYYEVGGKWATIQNFSTANTATWTPDMIADYTLCVDIKNSSGKVVKTLSKKFSATDPYSFTADMTSPQNIGKSVKFTAAGGASYKFYYQYAGAWVKIQDSTSATCNWKPNKAGEYMVYVDIKNASGAVVTCRTMKLVFNDPYRFTTSASSLTQPAGTAISLSANGGASYKFYYEKDGAWVRIQDYSTTKTCTWTPTEAGKYNVFCDIKDASGSVAVCKRITFTITEKCTITASKTNASVGDTITFTATGGSSYKFYYEKDGAWVRIQSFSTSNTCNWKPTAAGDYVVYVDVNDANGNLIGCKGVRCVVG